MLLMTLPLQKLTPLLTNLIFLPWHRPLTIFFG